MSAETGGKSSADPPVKTGRDQVGRFIKGYSGNRAGRPEGCKDRVTRFLEALKAKEEATGVSIEEHYVDQAHLDNAVLRDLAKKLLPDLQNVHHTGEVDEAVLERIEEVLAGIEAQNERLDERLRELDRSEDLRGLLAAPSPGWPGRQMVTDGGNGKSDP